MTGPRHLPESLWQDVADEALGDWLDERPPKSDEQPERGEYENLNRRNQ